MPTCFKNKLPVFILFLLFQVVLPAPYLAAQDMNMAWVKHTGGRAGDDNVGSVALDAAGNIYASGLFSGTCDFDPGPGVYNLVSNGNLDVFISKSDPNGNLLWARSMGGPNNDQSNKLVIDASGNVYASGHFFNTVDFDPGAGVYNLSSNGQWDAFIVKLDGAGNFLWARSMGGDDYDEPNSLALDGAGNVYSCGEFKSTVVDFDPGPGVANLYAVGGVDAYIWKLDTDGNFVWVKQIGGVSLERAFGITTDAPGNIYITGVYYDNFIDLDPGPGTYLLPNAGNSDIFILKLDATGNFAWAKKMGGTSLEQANTIVLDAAGNIYTTGYFLGPGDYDPGPGVFTLSSLSNSAIFISKLDASGNFVWAKQFGGTVSDPMVNNGISLVVDAAQHVYITGGFVYTVDFDPGPGTYNMTSAGWWDIYLTVLNASGDFIWAKQMGGNYIDVGSDLELDANGNIILAGIFNTVADFDPCAGTYNLTSNGATDFFIAKLAAPNLSITASNTSVCQGTPVSFTANLINGGPSPVYQWKVNGVNAGTNSSTFASSSLNNNDQVSCVVTVNPTCVPPVKASSNSITVTVEPGGTPSVSITASQTTICSGTPVTFTAIPVNAGTTPVYQWKINGINAGPNATVFTSNSLADNDVVSFSMTNPSPCVSPNTVNSNSLQMHVNPTIAPSVSITASANAVCAGIPVTFTATPANTGTPPSFQWVLNGNNVGSNSNSYVLGSPAHNDIVYCVMNSVSACSSNPNSNSNPITITVYPLPVITISPTNPVIPAGGSLQLQASVSGAYTSLLWTPAAGLSNPAVPNPVANPAASTTYQLEVVGTGNCHNTKSVTVKVIRDLNLPNAFTPDGNGINDVFRIPPGIPFTLHQFLIYNRYGNLVFSTTDAGRGWDGKYKGFPSPAGTYTYIIRGLDDRGHDVFITATVMLLR